MLIKPVTAVAAILLDRNGLYREGDFSLHSSYLYLAIINNLSISLSLYCLVLFYLSTEERLAPFSPLPKFLCIKSLLFFSFWQSCLFTMLPRLLPFKGHSLPRFHAVLLSVELIGAAIAQALAFDYRVFQYATKRGRGNVLRNIGNVLNVKDVISDAHNTFIKGDGVT